MIPRPGAVDRPYIMRERHKAGFHSSIAGFDRLVAMLSEIDNSLREQHLNFAARPDYNLDGARLQPIGNFAKRAQVRFALPGGRPIGIDFDHQAPTVRNRVFPHKKPGSIWTPFVTEFYVAGPCAEKLPACLRTRGVDRAALARCMVTTPNASWLFQFWKRHDFAA